MAEVKLTVLYPEVAADAVRISTGGPPLVLVGQESS